MRSVIEIERRKIAIQSGGAGNNMIVLLHRASMSAETWMPQLNDPELLRDYRIIAVDLPGHGASEWEKEDSYQLKPLSQTVRQLIEFLQPEKFIVAGLSLGSTVIGEITPPLAGCVGIMLVSPFMLTPQLSPDKLLVPNPLGHVMVNGTPGDHELKEFLSSIITDVVIAERIYQSYLN